MADEFQSGICSGNWWSSATSESSPCSTVINDVRSFGWPNDMGDIKARYSDESVSVSSSSMITSFGLSSPSLDWNQSLLRNSGTSENNLKSMLEEDLNSRSNYQQESGIEYVPVQKEWSPKNYSDGSEDSSVNAFTQLNQALGLDQNSLNSSKPGFPVVSSTTLLPDLFESHPQPEQHHYETREMNYSPPMNYQMNLNELSPSWQKFPQFVKPSSPKQRSSNQLHFSNNTHFWNASAAAAAAMNDVGSSFSLSPQTQFLPSNFEEKSSCSNMAVKMNTEDVQEKKSSETTFKRPRIETPSPLPTFKVRKEKLGDRITALQQLVSPFGKTDTASVLYEAIEYIRFLHEQVHVLSTPYMKNAAPMQYQQNSDKSKNSEAGPKQDLRSRGLCLVPVSSTYPVTTATTADFWNPTFGGTYR